MRILLGVNTDKSKLPPTHTYPQQVLGVDAHAAYDKALSTLMNVCHQHSFLHIPCPSVIPHLVTASEPSGTVFLTRKQPKAQGGVPCQSPCHHPSNWLQRTQGGGDPLDWEFH